MYKRKSYKPSQIARLRLITNSKDSKSFSGNYRFIMNEIKAGRLVAVDYGNKSRPYYTVSEAEIKRYLKKVNK